MTDTRDAAPIAGKQSPRVASGLRARKLGLFFAAAVFAFALLNKPTAEWSDQVGGLDESAVFGMIMAAVILVFNEIWVRWVRHRLSSPMRYGAILGFTFPIGYALGDQSAGFRVGVLDNLEQWIIGLGALDLWALGLGAAFLMCAAGMVFLLAPQAREEADLTRRDQKMIAAGLPIMLGEGVLLILLVLARQLDWGAPGVAHGAVLFLAGAAFLASIWFSAAIYTKMDELKRNLVYRQTTATFIVYFFLLAGWALAEAIGSAPGLDAFSAFLVLNAVYLGITIPWVIWSEREELAEAARR